MFYLSSPCCSEQLQYAYLAGRDRRCLSRWHFWFIQHICWRIPVSQDGYIYTARTLLPMAHAKTACPKHSACMRRGSIAKQNSPSSPTIHPCLAGLLDETPTQLVIVLTLQRYMDKLGLAAALRVKVMMKQTLIGLNGLLQYDLTPLPVSLATVLLHVLRSLRKWSTVHRGCKTGCRYYR